VIKLAGLGYGIEPVEGRYRTLVLVVVVICLAVALVVLSIMRGRKPPERPPQ